MQNVCLVIGMMLDRVLLAWFSALSAIVVRRVQSVLIQEFHGNPELQIVRIYFDYNYI